MLLINLLINFYFYIHIFVYFVHFICFVYFNSISLLYIFNYLEIIWNFFFQLSDRFLDVFSSDVLVGTIRYMKRCFK